MRYVRGMHLAGLVNIGPILYFVHIKIIFSIIVWELAHGRGTKEAYGIPPDELDMLSPAQQFAIKSGVQKAKIIRSSNMETIDFNIEDYQKFLPKKVEDEDDGDDEDNVA